MNQLHKIFLRAYSKLRIQKNVFLSKKSIFLLILVGFSSSAFGQQTPIYSQYFLNPYLFNPSKVGDSEYTQAFFLYRNQWAGVEGSPETQALTIDGRLKNEQVAVGVSFFNDITNIIGRTSGALTGAYRFKVAEDQQVSFGMSLQLVQNRIYFDRIVADDIDDPNLLNEENQQTAFDANFGLSYEWKRIEFGFAVDQLFQNDINFQNAAQFQSLNYSYVRHYIASLSYDHSINELFHVKPMVLTRLVEGLSPQYDFNLQFIYGDKVWMSGAYRHNIGIGGSVGFTFDDQFTVGYAYEFPNSDLSILGAGTHEFVFGIKLFRRPQNSPSASSTYRKRDLEAIQDENQEQFEKISQLEQEKEQRENEQRQTESLIDRQQGEILKLKQTILQLQGDMDKLKERDQYVPGQEDTLDNQSKYYLIIGAFRELANAKSFQKVIKREGSIDSKVIQNDKQTWFLIYTEEIENLKQVNKQIKVLEKSSIADLIVGTPWIFKKKN